MAYAAGDGPALVQGDPASLTLGPGDVRSISLRVDNAADVYGVELHLRFDPAILEVIDPQTGQPARAIAPGDWMRHGFAALNRVDNTAGLIDYAVTLVAPAPSLSGGGPVAVITFRGKAVGATQLTVQKAIVASREGKEIASQWRHATLTVTSPAPPPAAAPSNAAAPARFGAPELALAAFAVLALVLLAALVRRRR